MKSRFVGFTQHFPVEEQNGAECLILGGCCPFPFTCKVSQKWFYLGRDHILRMFFVVKKYVLFDPIQIGLFSFLGVMFPANGFADSFEKFFLGFGFIFIDIITYRDILMDKLLEITLYPVIVLIIFPSANPKEIFGKMVSLMV